MRVNIDLRQRSVGSFPSLTSVLTQEAGTSFSPGPRCVSPAIGRISQVQYALLVVMLVLAPLMARGVGQF